MLPRSVKIERKYQAGLVIGKFAPLHKGHVSVIQAALDQCDEVVVQASAPHYPDFLLSHWMQREWVYKIFAEDRSRIFFQYLRQPENLADSDPAGWAELCTKYLHGYQEERATGFGTKLKPSVVNIGAVFTSEPAYQEWADILGAEHIVVDAERKIVPISGTKLRGNIYKYWKYLPDPVKATYAKRVVITGAESTGTTTLSRALAKAFETAWVPEYGRAFYEGFSEVPDAAKSWVPNDLIHIARAQTDIVEGLAGKANRVLICDTDALTTQIWHWRYYDKLNESIEYSIRPADLYIVTGLDVPFEQDGFRMDPPEDRPRFQDKLKAELTQRGCKWIEVTGSREQRLAIATAAIHTLFVK